MAFSPYFSEDEFWKEKRRLDALFFGFGWGDHQARREHTDEFGDKIPSGEVYFSRDFGAGWHEKFKISRRSMEALLMILFSNNPHLSAASDALVKQEDAARLEAASRVADKMSELMGFPSVSKSPKDK